MKQNKPVEVPNNDEKPQIDEKNIPEQEPVMAEEDIALVEKIDKDEIEMREFRNLIYSSRGFCKTTDVAFIFVLFSIFACIWVFVYKLPVPEIAKQLFGMDDTMYPKE